ncbi:hypothetical protein QFZ75_000513 [Streptomyces sp. V3I8]|uniref:ester cyclase n=1 Tax=Streptomyces sp. V3I8 TaxID=3042279 RepID=UPI002787DC76|nr:ester cyclase [Streptomyces sp. V3I8]MDQ1034097.1 hypothetical protein [Streptomyces sp. V3I8]
MHVDDGRVAGRFTYRATFQGPFMGLPPTGRPVTMHSTGIRRVVDGMAVEHWDQLDEQAFFAQRAGDTRRTGRVRADNGTDACAATPGTETGRRAQADPVPGP